MKKIQIFDTTLRDGEQSPGCSMSAGEKLVLARQLEKLGVDTIEAGFAASSPGDFQSVQSIGQEIKKSMVVSLGRCSARIASKVVAATRNFSKPGKSSPRFS